MNGWVKLHRSLTEWEWYHDPVCRSVFIHLLLIANHQPKKYMGEDIPAGGAITSVSKLAEILTFSVQSIRTSLARLKSTNEITIKTTSKFSIITITKWDAYQLDNKANNNHLTNDQQASNNHLTTPKERKKERRKEKEEKTEKGTAFAAPGWLSPEIWQGFVEHRQRIRKPMTDHAKKLIVNELEGLRRAGHDPNECLERSIASGWSGVFPPKQDGVAGRSPPGFAQSPRPNPKRQYSQDF